MTMRKATCGVGAALVVALAGVAVTHGVSGARPGDHTVTYTVMTTGDVAADIQYMENEPPDMAAFYDDSRKYLKAIRTQMTGGEPRVFKVKMVYPYKWARVFFGGGIVNTPEFRCEIAVDGQVVVSQSGTFARTCATRRF